MRSWIKRLSVIAASLLLILAGVIFLSVQLLHGTPEWYRRSTATLAEKEASARSAFNKFAGIESAAASIRADRHAFTASDGESAGREITVSFSDDELNAFFEKWSNFENWKQNYDRYVDDPIIILRPKQILLAGRVREIDTIVSVQFEPSLTPDGQLDLHLTQLLGGRLPLPEALANPYFRKITDALRARLPTWRTLAGVQSDGAANKELISASLARMLIRTLQHQPADPILFLPVLEKHANVPVQIVAMEITDHLLTVTVTPLNAEQRKAMLARVRADDGAIDLPTDLAANR